VQHKLSGFKRSFEKSTICGVEPTTIIGVVLML